VLAVSAVIEPNLGAWRFGSDRRQFAFGRVGDRPGARKKSALSALPGPTRFSSKAMMGERSCAGTPISVSAISDSATVWPSPPRTVKVTPVTFP